MYALVVGFLCFQRSGLYFSGMSGVILEHLQDALRGILNNLAVLPEYVWVWNWPLKTGVLGSYLCYTLCR